MQWFYFHVQRNRNVTRAAVRRMEREHNFAQVERQLTDVDNDVREQMLRIQDMDDDQLIGALMIGLDSIVLNAQTHFKAAV